MLLAFITLCTRSVRQAMHAVHDCAYLIDTSNSLDLMYSTRLVACFFCWVKQDRDIYPTADNLAKGLTADSKHA